MQCRLNTQLRRMGVEKESVRSDPFHRRVGSRLICFQTSFTSLGNGHHPGANTKGVYSAVRSSHDLFANESRHRKTPVSTDRSTYCEKSAPTLQQPAPCVKFHEPPQLHLANNLLTFRDDLLRTSWPFSGSACSHVSSSFSRHDPGRFLEGM